MATGLRAVQLALAPIAEEPDRWGMTFTDLAAAGIEVASGMFETVGEDSSTLDSIRRTGGVVPDATYPATLDRARRVAEIVRTQGIRLVSLHAGFIPHEPGSERRKLLGRLREICGIFGEAGARVAFETGQESAATLAEALEELGDPTAGVNLDPANMILYGMGDPVRAARELSARIAQVHVKDALPTSVPGAWGREVVVGTGAVDWRAFLAALVDAPAPLRLVVEREAGEDRIGDVRAAIEFLRPLGIA